MLHGAPRFDPATEKSCFSIAMSDYVSLILMPPLMARLTLEAPGVEIIVRSIPIDEEPALDHDAVAGSTRCASGRAS